MKKKINFNPLISIIINCHNASNYISKSINSVIKQTYQNWELLIIDNYSTDNSDEVISSYNDSRIRVFKIKNEGIISKSRNYRNRN